MGDVLPPSLQTPTITIWPMIDEIGDNWGWMPGGMRSATRASRSATTCRSL